jgi:hypothetical protein
MLQILHLQYKSLISKVQALRYQISQIIKLKIRELSVLIIIKSKKVYVIVERGEVIK